MYTRVFRPSSGRVLVVAVAAFSAVALVGLAGDVDALLRWGTVPVLATVAFWAAYWRPEVVVDDQGVTLRNVSRTIQVPWAAYRGVDTRWSLEVRTADQRYTAWAAPRTSGTQTRARVLRTSERARDERLREGDHAEAAALTIIERAAALDVPGTDATASVTWHVGTLAALGALTVLAVTAALVV